MNRALVLVTLFLILPVLSLAQEAPPPPSSASLSDLIYSVKETQKEVSTLKRDMQEFKQQLLINLRTNLKDQLLFLSVFYIGFIFLLKIIERILSWFIWKRRAREILRFQEAVLNNLNSLDEQILLVSDQVEGIDKLLKSKNIAANLSALMPEIQQDKPGRLGRAGKILTSLTLIILSLLIVYKINQLWQIL